MSELPPRGVNHPLHRRNIKMQFASSEPANLERRRIDEGKELRDATFGLFNRMGGVQPGINWAIFEVPRRSPWNSEYEDSIDREILVVIDAREPLSYADIRIISNEPFKRGEDHRQYLTEDFTLDHEHDAQFFVDAVELGNDGELCNKESHSILFWEDEDEGMLVAMNYADFTQTHSVGSKRRKITVYPFGDPTNELDQLDALASARQLLAEVEHGELTHYGIQEDIE
jgi:hypothetical protein